MKPPKPNRRITDIFVLSPKRAAIADTCCDGHPRTPLPAALIFSGICSSMQNVEYKAELRDLPLAKTICDTLGASWVSTLAQTDTYFRVPDAKLKRRECVGYEPEWIFYSRSARLEPKLSNFTIYSDAQAQQRFGTAPLPTLCVIRKKRELYMSRGGVRIHLDQVEGVGTFIEFEALVCPERNLAECHRQLEELRQAFRVVIGEGISAGYSDLACSDPSAVANAGE